MPPEPQMIALPRDLVRVAGPDRLSFLNGLITNDPARLAPGHPLHAVLLTRQGQYQADFILVAEGADSLILDLPAGQGEPVIRALRPYRLRSQVTLEAVTDRQVVALLAPAVAIPAAAIPDEVLAYPDPRAPSLGMRCILPAGEDLATWAGGHGCALADAAAYEVARIRAGLPHPPADLVQGKTLALEANFDRLGSIDWQKGCYLGQETTARSHYRGNVRKRLVPCRLSAEAAAGTPVTLPGAPQPVGEVRSGVQAPDGAFWAMVMLRNEALSAPADLTAAGAEVLPQLPTGWTAATEGQG